MASRPLLVLRWLRENVQVPIRLSRVSEHYPNRLRISTVPHIAVEYNTQIRCLCVQSYGEIARSSSRYVVETNVSRGFGKNAAQQLRVRADGRLSGGMTRAAERTNRNPIAAERDGISTQLGRPRFDICTHSLVQQIE
jgi:hypothetical protein